MLYSVAVLMSRWSPAGAAPYFRYPYLHEGDTLDKRDAVRRWLSSRRYTVAQVTVDFQDWAWNDAYARCVALRDHASIERMKTTFLDAAKAALAWSTQVSARLFDRQVKHILLLHLGAFDAVMLDELLSMYRAGGVTFVGLTSAVQDPAYAVNPDVPWHGGRTFLLQTAEARRLAIPPAPDWRPALDRMCR
jgi:hypothetical protein